MLVILGLNFGSVNRQSDAVTVLTADLASLETSDG